MCRRKLSISLDKQDLQSDLILFMLENPRSQQDELMGSTCVISTMTFICLNWSSLPIALLAAAPEVKSPDSARMDWKCSMNSMSSALPNVASSAVSSGQLDRSKRVEVAFRIPVSRFPKRADRNLHRSLMRLSFSELKVELSVSLLLSWTFCQVFPGPTSSSTFWSLGPGSV